MRSPRPPFDLRAALTQEVLAAASQLEDAPASPEAVHRCRVHLKRARALARVGAASAPGLSALFHVATRNLMQDLGAARDLAAQAEAARSAAGQTKGKGARSLLRIAEMIDAMRALTPQADLAEVRAGLRDLLALAHVWPETSERQVRKGARLIAHGARAARRRGLASSSPKRRHEWRRWEKERLYASLLLDKAWPGKRRRKLAQRLTDTLGQERDLRLLIDRLIADPAMIEAKPKRMRRAMRALQAQRRAVRARANALGAGMGRA